MKQVKPRMVNCHTYWTGQNTSCHWLLVGLNIPHQFDKVTSFKMVSIIVSTSCIKYPFCFSSLMGILHIPLGSGSLLHVLTNHTNISTFACVCVPLTMYSIMIGSTKRQWRRCNDFLEIYLIVVQLFVPFSLNLR